MPYKEPYFARYVKSWKKPPKYIPGKIETKPLQHCKACTRTCDYYNDPGLCPFYDMQ